MAIEVGNMSALNDPTLEGDEKILALAKTRFANSMAWESQNREKMVDDFKFMAATPDDPWQWPEAIRTFRNNDPAGARPCLTINYMIQHVNQVVNDTKQNRPAIKVLPIDDAGDIQVAKVLNGMIRHIENVSDAADAYDKAHETQVQAGLGYIRVCTDYVSDDSFDQEIKIERIANPLTVYDDATIKTPTGMDRDYLFVSEMLTPEEFEHEYPNAEPTDWDVVGKGDDMAWYENGRIRVVEYWTVERTEGKLHMWPSGKTTEDDDEPPIGEAEGAVPTRTRSVMRRKVMFRKITGAQILEESEHAGRWIPFARVIGNEYNIEGEVYINGLIRPAKDAQRMYNYHASAEAELTALQPRVPFVGAAGQFEGFEDKWKLANVTNYAYLEYNAYTDDHPDDGTRMPLPPPQRVAPAPPQQAIIEIKRGAMNDIMATTGQYQPSLGKPSNEVSGRAIMYRNHEGDVGTFQYRDNLLKAIRFVGRIIVDLIPKIYDTRRVVRILGEDGEFDFATIDVNAPSAVYKPEVQAQPSAPGPATGTPPPVASQAQALQQAPSADNIYNPGMGRYDVVVTTGPSYTTKRQEALDAMVQLIQAQPELWQVVGDLLVKNMDWPGAEQMAMRLRAMLAPAVQQMLQNQIGGEQDPSILKAALASMQGALQNAQQQMQQLAAENQELKTHRDEKVMESQTKLHEADKRFQEAVVKAQSDIEVARITALGNIGANDGAEKMAGVVNTIHAALADHLNGMKQAASSMMQSAQSQPQPAAQVEERIQIPATPQTLNNFVPPTQ